jgi:hypothetical protein
MVSCAILCTQIRTLVIGARHQQSGRPRRLRGAPDAIATIAYDLRTVRDEVETMNAKLVDGGDSRHHRRSAVLLR